MSPARRNFMVGLVVLVAMVVFGGMALTFSRRVSGLFSPPQMPVHFASSRADGLSEGSQVTYLGVAIGHVTTVARSSDGVSIRIDALLDRNPPLPANVRADIIQSSAIGGGSTLQMEVDGETPSKEMLQPEAKLEAKYVGFQLNVLPPGFSETAEQIGKMSDQISKVAQQWHDSGTLKDLDQAIRSVGEQGERAGKVLDSIQAIIGDPQNRDNIKAGITNFRTTTETVTKIADKLDALSDSLQHNSTDAGAAIKDAQQHIDELSKQAENTLTLTSAVMTNLQSITSKVDQGKGSAGQFVNDPKLYESLVENTRQLDQAVSTLNRLEEQWEEEGVSLKLK
jgi:ABC-type transporter Mla subunit MlaD